MRYKAAVIVFMAMLLFGVSTGLTSAQTGGDLGSLINAYRQSKGLAPMAISGTLACGAQRWATLAAQQGVVGHQDLFTTMNRLQQCGDTGQFTGEIAAGNAGSGAAATLAQFQASPEHNSIILGPGNALGCGFAIGTFQGFTPFDFWVCDFAQEAASPAPTPQPAPNPSPSPNPQPGPCVAPLCGSTMGSGSFPVPASGGGTVGSGCFSFNCASTTPGVSSSGGAPASTPGFSTSGGAAASTIPGASSSGGAPASTGNGTSTSGGAVAGTGGTICIPPLCASTGGR